MIKQLSRGHFLSFIITIMIHSILWLRVPENKIIVQQKRPLIIKSMRTVGDPDSLKKSIDLKDRQAGKRRPDLVSSKGKKTKKEKLSLSDLAQTHARPGHRNLVRKSPLKTMFANKEHIKNFLKNSPSQTTAQRLINELGENDINIKFDIPEGVKLDELNKAELQFYSFQRRTAMNYVNTFYSELNNFNKQNPHLSFPIVDTPEKMTGRVTYDINGNIVRIKMLKWTDEEKLQDFFLAVLKQLNKLPNPPKAIVHNGEFSVFYTLNIKL